MKQTITKNNKNLEALNKLVANGFYRGEIGNEKFELIRNYFPNNYRLIGVLNNEGNYDIKFDYKSPMNYTTKSLLPIGVIIIIIFFIKGIWLLPTVLLVFGLTIFVIFRIKGKKEIHLFTDKLLHFHKTEFE